MFVFWKILSFINWILAWICRFQLILSAFHKKSRSGKGIDIKDSLSGFVGSLITLKLPDTDEDLEKMSYPQVAFEDQGDQTFNVNTATWLLGVVADAYRLFRTNRKTPIANGVTDAEILYWTNIFPITNEHTVCGYIGRIDANRNDDVNRIIIGLRGTSQIGEWISNGTYQQIENTLTQGKFGGKIEQGFYKIYTSEGMKIFRPGMRTQLNDALKQKYLSKTKKNVIYITGHSLGGAIATLVAADLCANYPDAEIYTYTFASPRLGDPTFAEGLEYYIERQRKAKFYLFRVHNTSDLVPSLPPPVLPIGKTPLLYEHVVNFPVDPDLLGQGNTITNVSFSINEGEIVANHAVCTYLRGISNDKLRC